MPSISPRAVRRIAVTTLLLCVLAIIPLACGGPIAAPAQVTDLQAHPAAFQEQFDAAAGSPRLVLLLSPA